MIGAGDRVLGCGDPVAGKIDLRPCAARFAGCLADEKLTDGDVDAEFFAQFAGECGYWRLTVFDLAAGNSHLPAAVLCGARRQASICSPREKIAPTTVIGSLMLLIQPHPAAALNRHAEAFNPCFDLIRCGCEHLSAVVRRW